MTIPFFNRSRAGDEQPRPMTLAEERIDESTQIGIGQIAICVK